MGENIGLNRLFFSKSNTIRYGRKSGTENFVICRPEYVLGKNILPSSEVKWLFPYIEDVCPRLVQIICLDYAVIECNLSSFLGMRNTWLTPSLFYWFSVAQFFFITFFIIILFSLAPWYILPLYSFGIRYGRILMIICVFSGDVVVFLFDFLLPFKINYQSAHFFSFCYFRWLTSINWWYW